LPDGGFSLKPNRVAKSWTDINLGVRNKLYFSCYCSSVLSQRDVIGKDSAFSVLGLGTYLLLEHGFSYLKEFSDENFGLHIVLQGVHLFFVFSFFLCYKCIVPNLEGKHLISNFVCVCGSFLPLSWNPVSSLFSFTSVFASASPAPSKGPLSDTYCLCQYFARLHYCSLERHPNFRCRTTVGYLHVVYRANIFIWKILKHITLSFCWFHLLDARVPRLAYYLQWHSQKQHLLENCLQVKVLILMRNSLLIW
jgi:hypothetical protein